MLFSAFLNNRFTVSFKVIGDFSIKMFFEHFKNTQF